ncbi:ABC transporter transmembrane domain-containing protein [Microseira sp. BLCC-F43]|uniref:ABC transporter transmembrane domain-containing protein n=1 Tax=Microseira sp. BLCC-F43 TaxID=3153602 RepID=UPI0035B84407
MLPRLTINGFVQAAATVANALLVELTFERLIAIANPSFYPLIWQIGLGLVAGAVVIGLLRVLERTDAEQIGQSYAYDVRMTLYNRLTTLAPRTLQSRSQGGVMLRFVGDLTALRQWVSLGLARLIVGITTTAAALIALAFLDWHLALTASIVLVIGSLSSFKLGQRLQRVARVARRHLSRGGGEKGREIMMKRWRRSQSCKFLDSLTMRKSALPVKVVAWKWRW